MVISAVSSVHATSLSSSASGGKIDPFAIFQLNFEAMGGEKQVKSASNFLYKGEIELGSQTLSIEEYLQKPLKSLRIISNDSLIITKDGNNGWNLWSERKGEVISIDYSNLPEREVQILWSEYAYTDPKNSIFASSYARKVSIDGTSCYEIKIRNKMTDEVVTQYYDAKTFLLTREIREIRESKTQTDFSDYRTVDNVKMAFKVDTTDLMGDSRQSIIWDTIEKEVFISESLFEAPDDKRTPKENSALLREIGARLNTYA